MPPAAAADLINATAVSIVFKNGSYNFPAVYTLPADFNAAYSGGDYNSEHCCRL